MGRGCACEDHGEMNRKPEESGTPTGIRLAMGHDAGETAAIYAPTVRGTIISFEVEPPTPDDMRRRVESTLERFPRLRPRGGAPNGRRTRKLHVPVLRAHPSGLLQRLR